MNEITIPFTGYYESHRKFEVTFTKGITTLVGKNGSGKSSMIKEMEIYLKNKNIPVFTYDHVIEERNILPRAMGFNGDITVAASFMSSSEGEKVIVGYGNQLGNIRSFCAFHKEDEIVVLLFDGLDSGVSINVIKELLEVFNLLITEFPNVMIVNTANNYEFLNGTRCVIAKNGKDKTFKTYNSFVKFICNQ